MATGRALIDAHGQGAHFRHPVGYFLPEQHAAAARLGPLANHHFDRIGFSQIVRVHPVARRQILIDQGFRLAAFLGCHAAVAGRRRGSGDRRAATQRFLGLRRKRAETHAGDGDRDVESDRFFGISGAEHHLGAASLAIAFEWIARHRRAEKQQIVEMRHPPLGAAAADIVNASRRRAADLAQGVVVERRRLAGHGPGGFCCHSIRLSMRRRCRCRNCIIGGPSRNV